MSAFRDQDLRAMVAETQVSVVVAVVGGGVAVVLLVVVVVVVAAVVVVEVGRWRWWRRLWRWRWFC